MNVLHLQKSMTELKMHQAPRGIHQKTIIQHTLRFSDEDECFQKFRLVCKTWKDAIETIRFNRFTGDNFLYNLDNKITSQKIFPASYLSKYLKLFRKLEMPLDLENRDKIFPLVLNNMKKLNEIMLGHEEDEIVGQQFDSFTFQILQNSNETLRTLDILKFVIPDISFPKLTNLVLRVGEGFTLLHEFQNYFPKALKNMENLKTVKIDLIGDGDIPVWKHICENYGKHCISGEYLGTLHVAPLKIMEQIENLEYSLENAPYSSYLEYAHVYPDNLENPMDHDWDRYQDIFDQCINLKAIEIETSLSPNFLTETLPTLSEANQEIWKERISYFQARGIRIANQNEIKGNENLRIKVAKEAGVTWRFHFW